MKQNNPEVAAPLPEPTVSDQLESQLATRLEQMEEVSPLPEIASEANPTLFEEVEKHRKELIFENQKLRQDNAQLQFALEQSEAAVDRWRSVAKDYESEALNDACHIDLREGFER